MHIVFLALAILLVTTQQGNAQPDCGDPPRVDDQSLKGTLDGKAQFLSKLIGDASLKGQLETARTDIFSKYPQADKTRSEAYLEYMLCSFVLSDPRVSPQEKIKAIQEFRQPTQSGENETQQGKLSLAIALNQISATAKNQSIASSTSDESLAPDQQITYTLKQEGGATNVSYHLPYLDLVRKGGPVRGLAYDRVPFEGALPELLVTVLNTTKHTVVLTGATLEIYSSRLVNEPIPVFDDLSQSCLRISNQGWADIVDPALRLSISRDTGEVALFSPEGRSVTLQTISDTACIPMREYVPAPLRRDRQVNVSGTLEYGAAGDRHLLAFTTRVKLEVRAGQGVLPDAIYNAFFKAGQAGLVPIDLQPVQQVKPDETAAFLLRIRTDRTSQSSMTIKFNTIDGDVIQGGEYKLDLFVPRIETRNWQIAGMKRP